MKLKHKLLLAFFVIVLLIGVLASLSINFSKQALQESIIDSSIALAAVILDKIDLTIHNKIEEFQEYSNDLILQQTVKESNKQFDKLVDVQAYIDKIDQEWTSASEEEMLPVMEELTGNKLARELRTKKEFYENKYGHNVFAEIFVTNKYGVNIAQTGKTSDYRQDDEQWWQKAKENGLYVEDVDYDKSANVYAIDYAIRIDDDNGNFIGIMKVVLDIEEIFDIIKNLKMTGLHEEHGTMHFRLANEDGKLIYSTEEFKIFEDVSEELPPAFRVSGHHSHGSYNIRTKPGEKEKLFIHSHSTGYRDYKGLRWILIINHETDEIFAPIIKLRNRILVALFFISALALSISLLFCRSITRPIEKLKKAVTNISVGNLDTIIEVKSKDEIGLFASSFHIMAENLKKMTADLQTKNMDLSEKQSELSALYTVSTAVSKTIEIDKLFDIILGTITGLEMLSLEQKAGIFIIEGNRMELVAHLGHPKEFLDQHKDMKVGDCLCGLAAETGEIIISKNSDKDCGHTIRYPEMTPHGHIIIPLKVRTRVVGVLYLYTLPDIEMDNDKIDSLVTIGNQIGIAVDNARLYEETKEYSLHDPLTGLANRRMMGVVLERNLIMAKRSDKPFSIIMMDIDYFKKYNDTHGHSEGDRLLTELAKLVIRKMRQIDLAVRYGGEEFLLLLPETDLKKAYEAAERLRKAVEVELGTTISLGVASYNEGIEKEEDLIKKADNALYHAKQKGRNRVEVCGLNDYGSILI